MTENDPNAGEIRDTLPADLNAVDNLGSRDFPDNSRRRIPGVLYAVIAVACAAAWAASGAAGPGRSPGASGSRRFCSRSWRS